MHRTTILLPETLRREAETAARAQGLTLSELIRRKLAGAVAARTPNRRKADPLFRPQLMHDKGPHDISLRHDDYLYGPQAKSRSGKTAH